MYITINTKYSYIGRVFTRIICLLKNNNNSTKKLILMDKKIKISGNKNKKKIYYHHSGYPGGIKQIIYSDLIIKNLKKIIYFGLKGMLPKNKITNKIHKKILIK